MVLKDGIDAETANAAIAAGANWRDYAEAKPIEEVQPGDFALSRPEDDAEGRLSFNLVTQTYANTTEEVVELWVVNYATGEYDHITTTPGHPFWVGDQWTFAAEIVAGDHLVDTDGDTLTVASATSETRHEATYNFCVAWDHTYYVGGTATWVHNASKTYPGPYAHLEDPPSVGPGKDFTARQKAEIYAANRARNGGRLRDDVTGRYLAEPQKSRRGVTPNPNEAQVDHINPRNPSDKRFRPGSNSYANAQVTSRAVNRAMSNTPKSKLGKCKQ